MKFTKICKSGLTVAVLTFSRFALACEPPPPSYIDKENMTAVLDHLVSSAEGEMKIWSISDVSETIWQYKVVFAIHEGKSADLVCKAGVYTVNREYKEPESNGMCPELKSVEVKELRVTNSNDCGSH